MVLTHPDPPDPPPNGRVVSPDSSVSNIRNSISRFWNNQVIRSVTPPGQRPTFIAPSATNNNNNNNVGAGKDIEERLHILRNGVQTTPSSQVSDISHSSKLAFLNGASIEELQQALSIKMKSDTVENIVTNASNPPTSGMHPRAIFPATVAPDNSPKDSTLPILPVGLEVFCRVNGTIMAGEIASVPTPNRDFYLVHSFKTDNFFEVSNNPNHIWEDTSGINKRPASNAPVPTSTSSSDANQLRKELWTQRQKTDFKKLPTCGKECMNYHDDMYILLGCKAWRTKTGSHILDSFTTTTETKDFSGELYHLLTRGTTTKGTAATEAFPIMKDPNMVDKGLECYWSIFQQFCPLHEADVPRMLKDFQCTLQLTGQSPVLVRSKLTIQRSWLLRANYKLPEKAVIMQLAIALEYGAYAFAYDDLWMSYRRGEHSLFDETLESLVDVADTYLRANKKACPQPGVYAKVANPPALMAPDHSTTSGTPPRARPATVTDDAPTAAADSAIVQQMLAAGPVDDEVAKEIRDTFKCVFHLQPWPQNRRKKTGHFLTHCKVAKEKYKCEYVGGRQQERNDDDGTDGSNPPRGRRAGGDNPSHADARTDGASGNSPSNNPPPSDSGSDPAARSYAAAAANAGSSRTGGNSGGEWTVVRRSSTRAPVTNTPSSSYIRSSNRFLPLQDEVADSNEGGSSESSEKVVSNGSIKVKQPPKPKQPSTASTPPRRKPVVSHGSPTKPTSTDTTDPKSKVTFSEPLVTKAHPSTIQPGSILSHVKKVRLDACDPKSTLVLRAKLRAARINARKAGEVNAGSYQVICIDSGSTHDLFSDKACFITYKPLAGKYILAADDSPLQVLGQGTVEITINGRTIRLKDCYHVPSLSMPLLSVRVHRRRGDGCYFLADEFQCVLAFPTFAIDIDDTEDCVVAYQPTNRKEGTGSERIGIDYDDSVAPEQRIAFAREASQLVVSRGAVPTTGLLRFSVRKAQARSQARLELHQEATEGTLPTCRAVKDPRTPRQSRRKQAETNQLPPPVNPKSGSSMPIFDMGEEDLGFERDLLADLDAAVDDDEVAKAIDNLQEDDDFILWENDTVCSATESESDDDESLDRGNSDDSERGSAHERRSPSRDSPIRGTVAESESGVPSVISTTADSSAIKEVHAANTNGADTGDTTAAETKGNSATNDEADDDDTSLPIPRSDARIPTIYVPESHVKRKFRVTNHYLHKLLGSRKLRDYSTFAEVVENCIVEERGEVPLTIGDIVNHRRGNRNKKSKKPRYAGHTICADIGYGDGISPGGHRYCIVFVCKATRFVWIYGLRDLHGETITEALYDLVDDMGGFPKCLQCDFDTRFLGGRFRQVLRKNHVRVTAAPPRQQSQNGLVERTWAVACRMARSFLAEARLPKYMWFWAVREAAIRMNMIPIRYGTKEDPKYTTSFEMYYACKPDANVLFPFGCIGYFDRERDGTTERTTFQSQTYTGIAVGRHSESIAMIFWCPEVHRFNTSSEYTLDCNRDLKDAFPDMVYDGGLELKPLHKGHHAPLPFTMGSPVQFQLPGGTENEICSGTVIGLPVPKTKEYYTVSLEDGSSLNLETTELWSPSDAIGGEDVTDPTQGDPIRNRSRDPPWLVPDARVVLEHDGSRLRGYLHQLDTSEWVFEMRDRYGLPQHTITSHELGAPWHELEAEGVLELGWDGPMGHGRHVSAKTLVRACPGFLWKAMDPSHPDYLVWYEAYKEEYEGLRNMNTYTVITKAEVDRLGVTPIPTMNILNIKPDEKGNPKRAKSRTVVLGNEEVRCWEKSEVYAPVLSKSGSRLFVANGIAKGRITKQADAKNAFVHSTLPGDEICVVTPPKGCPFSKPGDYWLLNKTLYGLRRSPHHWFKTLEKAMHTIGLEACPHDPCIYVGQGPNGSTIHVGTYVDDIIYYGDDDEVEAWFEQELKKHITVDFMGAVSWYLGIYYEWNRTTDGRLTVHMSQEAMVQKLLDQEDMPDCLPVKTPYRSGLVIDRIPHDGMEPKDKSSLVSRYQSVLGGLTWLSINTRPDISAVTSLLASHIKNPSQGHIDAAMHVLKYLKGSSDWGIRYTSPDDTAVDLSESRLKGNIMWPVDEPPAVECRDLVTHTDANWGPQDASKPTDGETRQPNECKSLAGAITMFMGGPLDWKVVREKRMSRSSCEAEIKAMDEGCKLVEYLQHLLREMKVPDGQYPAPLLYNDNKGAVCWSLSEAITKKLRHLNIREVAVRDAAKNGDIVIGHIPGVLNFADIFTKEMKDGTHFCELRAALMSPRVATPASSSRARKIKAHSLLTKEEQIDVAVQALTQYINIFNEITTNNDNGGDDANPQL